MGAIKKNITISEEMSIFIKKNNLNLSGFVREKLLELMKESGVNLPPKPLDHVTLKKILGQSRVEDWIWNDGMYCSYSKYSSGENYCITYIYKGDLGLKIEKHGLFRDDNHDGIKEEIKVIGWEKEFSDKFPDKRAWYTCADIYYNNTFIESKVLMDCDRGRITIPCPGLEIINKDWVSNLAEIFKNVVTKQKPDPLKNMSPSKINLGYLLTRSMNLEAYVNEIHRIGLKIV